MSVRRLYYSRFYRLSKFIVVFIIIFTLMASYKGRIKLSESIMSIIICILGLIIQKIDNEYKRYKQNDRITLEQQYKYIIESDLKRVNLYYDDITGIPNRKVFTKKIDELINNNSNSKSQLGIIFLILIILRILMIHMDMK